MSRIAVIGGGAWGTALAALEARAGRETVLYARDPATVADITETRRNRRYLPGLDLPPALRATSDLGAALAGAAIVLLVTPAQTLREILPALAAACPAEAPLVLCAKGIERGTGRFASEIAAEHLGGARIAVLSGPSFAADVAAGLPTAVTLAAAAPDAADRLALALSTETFRIYASTDILGVEAGGALKNVLAIAAGIVAGRGLGASAGAAVVTRGLGELRRLGEALGARPETMTGLSGLGDLVLTCSGPQSRNFAYGLALGRGADLAGLKLAEGVFSAAMAADLARRHGIDAPLIATVAAILADELSVDEAARRLLSRPLKRESD
ncbi:glycerol-3-phosphate dehydrogenase [NAD(P)+] [Aureimonas endophytica]|uniref:Glycerol-3-phosphate dehydrogenase [NAD(P)+] n=1 Tax=Aureimonas endophytica TaxID=2027858 RepID=A0A916ZPV7_9HYPH|nr:NAD(P)H-dependent glycerol-3-phosphate dehydrogenase [Aureimonas endophytica]GGE08282.1 glycerol-3-phosphate dehydrogenase [NAD(P)+] [Aureimonas endophytica]